MHDSTPSQPWTAARCHRLLRQLESRLSTLRKLIKPDACALQRKQQTKRQADETSDMQPPKRIKHTYTSKPRRSMPNNSKPFSTTPTRPTRAFSTLDTSKMSPKSSSLHFPTPVATRYIRRDKHWKDQTNNVRSSTDEPNTGVQSVPRNLLEAVRHLRHTVPDAHLRIYMANFQWFANHLQATESKPREAHPKSLLGMCLRKIPMCVENIEEWERNRANDRAIHSIASSPTVSMELYEQLEAFGSSETGWRPLKIAARAHATRLLQKATAEGLFEPTYVSLLVRLCHHFHCPRDAGILATAARGTLPRPKNLQSTFAERYELQPLHALVMSAAGNQGRGLVFHHISSLIKQGRLHPEWIASKAFAELLSGAIQSVTLETSGPSEMKLLVTVIETLCVKEYVRSEACHEHGRSHALIRVAAGLAIAAIGLANSKSSATSLISGRNCSKILRILDCSINGTRRRFVSLEGRELSVIPVMAFFLAVTSNELVSQTLQQQAARELEGIIAGDESRAHLQYRQAMFLACSITQGIRQQEEQVAGHECLANICNQLDKLRLPGWFRRGLRTDGAFLFAQKTKNLRDLAFAEQQFQSTNMGILAKPGSEPGRVSSIFSGWRWEEGISEWVLPSPDKAGEQAGKTPGNRRECTLDGDVFQIVIDEAEVEIDQGSGWVMNQQPSTGAVASEDAQVRFRGEKQGQRLIRPGGTGVHTGLQERKETNSVKTKTPLDSKPTVLLQAQGHVSLDTKEGYLGTRLVPDSASRNVSHKSGSRREVKSKTRNVSICDGASHCLDKASCTARPTGSLRTDANTGGTRTVTSTRARVTHGKRQPKTKSMRGTGQLLIVRGANQIGLDDVWAPA